MNVRVNGNLLASYIFLFLSQAMVSVNIVASKSIIDDFPIFLLLEARFIFATFFMALTIAAKPKMLCSLKELSRSDWWLLFFQGLTAGFLFNMFLLSGLHYTSASVASVIASTLPAIIAVLSFLVLKETLSKSKYLSILFAIMGVIIINIAKPFDNSNNIFGDFIILIALLPEAAYYILVKIRVIKIPIILQSCILNCINMLLLLPIAIITTDKSAFDTIHLSDWFIVAIIGIASALFFSFWSKGCKNISGSNCALMTATMPISTILIAMVFLGEKLVWLQWIGVIFILLAIVVSTRNQEYK